jgi:small-conductance mechanosensitive channel
MTIEKAPSARPLLVRAAAAGVAVVGGLILASFGTLRGGDLKLADWVPVLTGTALVLIAGVVAVRSVAGAARRASGEHLGDARGAVLALVITIVGYFIVLLLVLQATGVPLQGLFLGGAITGVVLGIAAQQTLANFFAGIVLLVVRPLTVGEEIVLRSGPLGGDFEGLVTNMSLFYVNLETATGPVALPNASVLMAAIGPGAKPPPEDDDEADRSPAPDHLQGTA